MKNKYQINFMPESYPEYCSTACLMWILNYFWYTQFNMKDTRDVIKIGKMGKFKYKNILDEHDIAYCLDRLWFNVTIYHEITEQEHNQIFIDPIKAFKRDTKEEYHKHIQWNSYIFSSGRKLDISAKKIKKIKEQTNIKHTFDSDFAKIIKTEQNENTLFLLGLDGYILSNESYPHKDFCWGHVVLCKWYKNRKFEIYDSWPKKQPLWIDEKTVENAMKKSRKYHFLKITPNDVI